MLLEFLSKFEVRIIRVLQVDVRGMLRIGTSMLCSLIYLAGFRGIERHLYKVRGLILDLSLFLIDLNLILVFNFSRIIDWDRVIGRNFFVNLGDVYVISLSYVLNSRQVGSLES